MSSDEQPGSVTADEAFIHLRQYLEWQDGYSLVLIFSNPHDELDKLYKLITRALGSGLDVTTNPLENLSAYAAALANEGTVGEERAFVWMRANPTAPGWEEPRRLMLNRLNEQRDRLKANIGKPFFVVLPQAFHIKTRDQAPDLWSARNLTIMLADPAPKAELAVIKPYGSLREPLSMPTQAPLLPTGMSLPGPLLEAFAQRRVVLLAANECGRFAGLPNRVELLQRMKERYEEEGYLRQRDQGMFNSWIKKPDDYCRAFQMFRTHHRPLFGEILENLFDPDPRFKMVHPPHFYAHLRSLAVAHVVTLGFDLLFQDALENHEGLTWQDAEDHSLHRPSIFHYYGRADRPGTMVLTLEQVRAHAENKAADQRIRDLGKDHTFLLVGFPENDPQIPALQNRLQDKNDPPWFVLGGVAGEGLVAVDLPDEQVGADAVDAWFRVVLQALGLEAPPPQESDPQDNLDWRDITTGFLDGLQPTGKDAIKDFYRGEPPEWAHVVHEQTVWRVTTDKVLKELRLEEQSNRTALILSAGGEGKSTILKQVGLKLVEQGYRVMEALHDKVDPYQVMKRISGPLALLLDDAQNLHRLKALIEFAKRRRDATRLVLAARENEWNDRQDRLGDARRLLSTQRVERLTSAEAEQLAVLLLESGADKTNRNRADLAMALQRETGRFLLAAMLMATEGRPLEAILADVVAKIAAMDGGEELIEALGLVCAVEVMVRRIGKTSWRCPLRLFLKAQNLSKAGAWRLFHRLAGEVSLKPKGDRIVETRHPLIAEALYPILFAGSPLYLDSFSVYAHIVKTAARISREAPKSFERNYTTIVPLFFAEQGQVEEARHLFRMAVDIDPTDAAPWQAWALREKGWNNRGDCKTPFSARWLFQKALEADPNHLHSLQAWAMLERDDGNLGDGQTPYSARWLFRRAFDVDPNDLPNLQAWADLEAKDGNMGDSKTTHSARWLFNRALGQDGTHAAAWHSWALAEWRLGERDEAERLVREGLRHCPRDNRLKSLQKSMENNPSQTLGTSHETSDRRGSHETQQHEAVLGKNPSQPGQEQVTRQPRPPSADRDQIFISYCRQDKPWLEQLLTFLKPVQGQIPEIWHDGLIKPGDLWRDEIRTALQRARVALLLVSSDFLASDFIAKHELPALLKAAQHEGATIMWIPLRSSMWEATELATYQAVIDPGKVLNAMTDAEREEAWVTIARKVAACFKP